MAILKRLLRNEVDNQRALAFQEWVNYFNFNGLNYPFIPSGTLGGKTEEIGSDFAGIIEGAYKANGIVFACMLTRLMVFSEARFQFRQIRNGRPGNLFGTPALKPLETPWMNATTGDLLTRMIQDADLAGNFFGVDASTLSRLRPDRTRAPQLSGIRRMRPDWVTIVSGSETDPQHPADALDAEIIAYFYHPNGISNDSDPIILRPDQVAHFAPIPDPAAHWRGMSWLTPVLREVMGDQAANTHKLRFFENGATPNLVVTVSDKVREDAFERWVSKMEKQHAGLANAYKTLYLGGGADAKVVGADLKQIEFAETQSAGEVRIAAAAGVPPVIAGLAKGLESSTYSNYSQARRRFADGTMRPLWRNAAGSLASIVKVPTDSELWYDDRDIAFLREDEADAANIQQTQSISIKTLIDAGYTPESVVKAIQSGDFSQLAHSGLVSVQLFEPGADPNASSSNGQASADNSKAALLRLLGS